MKARTNYQKCKQWKNRYVLIKTKQGQVYEGKIVKVSNQKVYIKVSNNRNGKKARVNFFFFNPILPLVLFDLLVIVLLDRPRRRFFY